ncbi:NAD(P)-dependent dehydrogenase (short-subunit alcohol dehydrogenase family) [Streptomyces africanus]|uniref:NAD(P)-dependent dehydrogenase (Short-subunit alcohol dehydrogenase family) n=1 Tax=Streptomyces africanus TaxID=231024 RepID=A0ABU0R0L2_9ACTN|nr:NAD(P)-dependent dehydrogenase (short-subunit alcohol dehydrogenase family) [Streptomyces africanus]
MSKLTRLSGLSGLKAVVTGGASGIGLSYLASPAAASVTGIALAVDGGMQGLRLRPAVGA